jgi:hypothetical protein
MGCAGFRGKVRLHACTRECPSTGAMQSGRHLRGGTAAPGEIGRRGGGAVCAAVAASADDDCTGVSRPLPPPRRVAERSPRWLRMATVGRSPALLRSRLITARRRGDGNDGRSVPAGLRTPRFNNGVAAALAPPGRSESCAWSVMFRCYIPDCWCVAGM